MILRRLNKEGFTELYLGNDSGGPKRKYYRITEAGKTRLWEAIADWEEIKERVSKLGIP